MVVDNLRPPQNAPDRKNQNQSKSCYFCSNTFSADHRKSCQARDVECRSCKKKGHLAKMCNSERRVKRVKDEDFQVGLETEVDNIVIEQDEDSEPEYSILSIQPRKNLP